MSQSQSLETTTHDKPRAGEGTPLGKRALYAAVIVLAALALVLGAVLIARKSPPPVKARNLGARLDLAAGDVTVTEVGGAPAKAISGDPLATDSHITTAKGARALVRTGDGAAVFLRGETEIALNDHGIELVSGQVWLDAPRVDGAAIEVSLGKDAASASDAGLSILRQGDDVTVYVARGLSILTAPGGRVEIKEGEQGVVHATDAPKVSPVAFWQDWTGGMADSRPVRGAAGSGSGRIYGIDLAAPPGSPARKLGIAKESVHAVIRDGVSETEVDQTFSNPSGSPIEIGRASCRERV